MPSRQRMYRAITQIQSDGAKSFAEVLVGVHRHRCIFGIEAREGQACFLRYLSIA